MRTRARERKAGNATATATIPLADAATAAPVAPHIDGVISDGSASTHQRSPSSGEIASATRQVTAPPAAATTIETPKTSRGVARLRARSTAFAIQTHPTGTCQMPTLSDARA